MKTIDVNDVQGGRGTRGPAQPYTAPVGLLDAPATEGPRPWTCVRTRPRWEKKFAKWLLGRGIPHFLPVVPHETISHRKHRVTLLPALPGYVFVQGDYQKFDFQASPCVAYLLKPRNDTEMRVLDEQLRALWSGLQSGSRLEMTTELTEGELVEIVSGPMRGHRGRFLRRRGKRRLVLNVDLVGSGIVLELPDTCVVRDTSGPTPAHRDPVAAGT